MSSPGYSSSVTPNSFVHVKNTSKYWDQQFNNNKDDDEDEDEHDDDEHDDDVETGW